MPEKWGELFWSKLVVAKLPGMATKENPIGTILAHSYTDAPVALGEKKYPVLLFEPGFGNVPLMYASVIEDLASHGYIVAGIVPTYYTTFTVFSDGRVPDIAEKFGLPLDATSEEQRDRASRLLQIWAGDMLFTLNQLEKLDANADSPFDGQLDFEKVGAFGHSFGGPAALQAAKDEEKIKAAANLDGRMFGLAEFGDVAALGLPKPVLLFDHPLPDPSQKNDEIVFRDGQPAYRLTLAGSMHSSFTDEGMLPFLGDGAKKAMLGTIEPGRALSITSTFLDAFFDKYLNGKPSPLLSGPSAEYPEITFETNK